ncbi:hypothetical protein NDU88_007912 [Pleurodeles waltl]|uniref:Uncharacterized protein n=1 Tax=Pleurodeles waltl TaxID=8319 RepID=A0AAV7VV01_PLEWA|nr:hypothetical protein NDU88_007912 [Pleurodeles waltl]
MTNVLPPGSSLVLKSRCVERNPLEKKISMQSYAFYAHRTLRNPWIVASALQKRSWKPSQLGGLVSVPLMKVLPRLAWAPRPDRELCVAPPAIKNPLREPLERLPHSDRIVGINQRETPYSASLATRLGGGFRRRIPHSLVKPQCVLSWRALTLSQAHSLTQPQSVTGPKTLLNGIWVS